jgi:hypothetical protein
MDDYLMKGREGWSDELKDRYAFPYDQTVFPRRDKSPPREERQ